MLLFFGVRFKVAPAPRGEEDGEDEGEEKTRRRGTGEVVVSCVGVGYSNINKSMA